MRLADYLAERRPPWDWQEIDCCRWVDGWVQRRGHGSPMKAINIRYDSERSAMRRIAEGGGLVMLWAGAMALLGVPEADLPTPGDVGIVACPDDCGIGEIAAIFTGERWVLLGVAGLIFAPAQPLRVWRL